MKRKTRIAVGVLLGLGLIVSQAQTYSIDSDSITDDNIATTGGVYSVTGALGTFDLVTTSNGVYSVTTSFSTLTVVQTPGAPLLRLEMMPVNRVALIWPWPSTGFVLQQNNDLGSTNWITLAVTPTHNGTNNLVSINTPTGNRFFRLFKP